MCAVSGCSLWASDTRQLGTTAQTPWAEWPCQHTGLRHLGPGWAVMRTAMRSGGGREGVARLGNAVPTGAPQPRKWAWTNL